MNAVAAPDDRRRHLILEQAGADFERDSQRSRHDAGPLVHVRGREAVHPVFGRCTGRRRAGELATEIGADDLEDLRPGGEAGVERGGLVRLTAHADQIEVGGFRDAKERRNLGQRQRRREVRARADEGTDGTRRAERGDVDARGHEDQPEKVAGPFAVVAWIGVLSPLLYYARLTAIGLDRAAADARTPIAWRPRLRPFDVTRPRAWFAMTWSDDRALIAAATALLLAVFALSVSAGGFGGPQAAAGLPPSLQGGEGVPNEEIGPPTGPDASFEPEESFDPEASFDPDASFDAEPIGSEGPEPGASLESDPSFEPVPTE